MRILASLAVAVLALSNPVPALAQSVEDVISGTILQGWRMENGAHMAAVRLELAPGWKTYWRAPGDAGIPPSFNWRGSENIAAVRTHWPIPDVFDQNGMRSVGYHDVVTIPLEIRPARPGEAIAVEARLDVGVCLDICIPASLELTAQLPLADTAHVADIRAALADRPMTAREAGVGRVVCRTEPIADGLRVTVTLDMPALASEESAVVELADPSVWVAEPVLSRSGRTLTAVTEMVPPNAAPFAMARQDLRLTVLGGGRGVDIRGCTGS